MLNTILDKNLSYISRYSRDTALKISNVTALTKEISLIETNLGEPNFRINSVDVHSQSGAEKESVALFNEIEDNSNNLCIVLGFGLGYLFKEFAEKSKGLVVCYEPDVEVLRATLEIVDFSNELVKSNVFVTSNLDKLCEIVLNHWDKTSNVSFSFLPTFKILYPDLLEQIVDAVKYQISMKAINNNYYKSKLPFSTYNLFRNIPYLINEEPLGNYKDIYKGKTAVVVSAGPTLDENIEILKKYRDRYILFCVEVAAKTLLENGLKPDFIANVEIYNKASTVNNLDVSDSYLIIEPISNQQMRLKNFKKILSYPAVTSPVQLLWKEISGIGGEEYVSSGTVSFTAMNSAKMLGFSKIILVGQDLAYLKGSCYSSGSVYKDVKCVYDEGLKKYVMKVEDAEAFGRALVGSKEGITREKYAQIGEKRINHLNKSLNWVKSVSGEMLPTEIGYATFVKEFGRYALDNSEIEFVNSSMKGALIDGFDNIPLEEALKNEKSVEIKELNGDFKLDKSRIMAGLKPIVEDLELKKEILMNNFSIVSKIDKELSLRKVFNEKCLRMFRELVQNYINITTHAQNSVVYLAGTYAISSEVQNALSQSKSDDMPAIYEVLKIYYVRAKLFVENLLNYYYEMEKSIESVSSES